MTPDTILTRDLEKLRRQAKTLKKQQCLSHMQALEALAQQQGFLSWHHACRCAENNHANIPTHPEQPSFRFAMDVSDVRDYSIERLTEAGIVEDDEFGSYLYDEFIKSGTDPDDWWEQVIFRHTKAQPKNTEEAIKAIREVFFFPPLAIWLDGKEIVIDHYADDEVFICRS